jgi:hypothetical protein
MGEPLVAVQTIPGCGHSDPNVFRVTAATHPQGLASGR